MRIRSRRVLRVLGGVAGLSARGLLATIRTRETAEDPAFHPLSGTAPDFIVVTWHENLFAATWSGRRFPGFFTLVSNSRDGEAASGFAAAFGIPTVRGSSTRGGASALREIVEHAQRQSFKRLGLFPDGPHGPRRQAKPGAIYVASRCGIPVLPVGVAFASAWTAKSWDRMKIPKPFSRMAFHVAAPIRPPADLAKEGVEHYCRLLEREMDRVQQIAEANLQGRPATIEVRAAA